MAQAAFYTLGEFGEMRDAVIATMDTGNRTWDNELIPADRLEKALRGACEWLGGLAAHHVRNGPGPRRPAGARFHRQHVAVPVVPLPGGLPAGG